MDLQIPVSPTRPQGLSMALVQGEGWEAVIPWEMAENPIHIHGFALHIPNTELSHSRQADDFPFNSKSICWL